MEKLKKVRTGARCL